MNNNIHYQMTNLPDEHDEPPTLPDHTLTDEEDEEEVEWIHTLTENDEFDLCEIIYEMIDDTVFNEPDAFANPSFHETVIDSVASLLHIQILEADQYNYIETDYDNLYKLVEKISDIYFEEHADVYPIRSFNGTFPIEKSPAQIEELEIKIQNLIDLPQPKQRTPEWYKFRHQLITASNIWKALGSEKQQNSLIYEKCKPLDGDAAPTTPTQESGGVEAPGSVRSSGGGTVNTSSSLHKGVKYEPLSAMIYEDMYQTRIADFGCVKHPTHSFIGASPDGINVCKTSGRYGRMLEIKNIVNREINGIPKKEYWIQMQLQMETFDLDECDFFETQFKEYQEGEPVPDTEYKGLILYFIEKDDPTHTPVYVYMPLHEENKEEWIESKINEMSNNNYVLYNKIYWYLEKMSCVLVKRNREWFKSILPKIKDIWKIIERERVQGYEHRCPTKRVSNKNAAILHINKQIATAECGDAAPDPMISTNDSPEVLENNIKIIHYEFNR